MSVESVVRKIKAVEIQGASNVAKAALKAYARAKNRPAAAKKLKAARPTEPMLWNVLELAKHQPPEKILGRLGADEGKITEFGVSRLGQYNTFFTHCHSTTVMRIIKAINPSVVYNTEARPLYQGRTTAEELASAGIKVEHSVDSLMARHVEKCDAILLGADAITERGFYNKVGSLAISVIAKATGKPVFVCAHSFKFTKKDVEVERRSASEVWGKSPCGVAVLNPAFEFVPKEYVAGVICEKGAFGFDKFLRKIV